MYNLVIVCMITMTRYWINCIYMHHRVILLFSNNFNNNGNIDVSVIGIIDIWQDEHAFIVLRLQTHFPAHWQSGVHLRLILLHVYLLEHKGVALQHHLISCLQLLDASGKVLHNGIQRLSFLSSQACRAREYSADKKDFSARHWPGRHCDARVW